MAEAPAPPSVGVLTIATNRYLDYWKVMAASADRHLFPGSRLALHVFTDRPDDARATALERATVDAIEIDPLGWPDATLLRYEIFDASRDRLLEDVLIHLDADMLVERDVGPELAPDTWRGGIALVRHPGFRRPGLARRAALYATNPRIAASDARATWHVGGIGSWEQDERSRAFVPREARRTYVCGGTWMGQRAPLHAMIHELATRTREDLDEGRIAVWHDESHLNWFASTHDFELLGSDYCFAPGFANLADLTPRIVAVDKGDERTR